MKTLALKTHLDRRTNSLRCIYIWSSSPKNSRKTVENPKEISRNCTDIVFMWTHPVLRPSEDDKIIRIVVVSTPPTNTSQNPSIFTPLFWVYFVTCLLGGVGASSHRRGRSPNPRGSSLIPASDILRHKYPRNHIMMGDCWSWDIRLWWGLRLFQLSVCYNDEVPIMKFRVRLVHAGK